MNNLRQKAAECWQNVVILGGKIPPDILRIVIPDSESQSHDASVMDFGTDVSVNYVDDQIFHKHWHHTNVTVYGRISLPQRLLSLRML